MSENNIDRIVKICVTFILSLYTQLSCGSEDKSYYLYMHDNTLYKFYPSVVKGDPISEQEANKKGHWYLQKTVGDEILVTVVEDRKVFAEIRQNKHEQIVWLKNSSGICEYENINTRHLNKQKIIEVCRNLDGEFRRKVVKDFYHEVLIKRSRYSELDELIDYTLYDYSNWLEYRFSPEGVLLQKDEMMIPGK